MSCYSTHRKKCIERFGHQEHPQRLEQISHFNQLDTTDLEDLEDSDEGDEPCSAREDDRTQQLATDDRVDLDIKDLTGEAARNSHSDSWAPWWRRAGLPEVISKSTSEEKSIVGATQRSALKPPAHVCCVEGRMPHHSVAFTSLSALYAYVHTMRTFNGGWEWATLEAASHLLHLCPGICSHQVYSSAEECLHSSLEATVTLPNGGLGAEFDMMCLADARALIDGGPGYCMQAMQDIVEIFDASLAGGGCRCSGKLRRGIKKVEFLTSFVFHHFDILEPLRAATFCQAGPSALVEQ